MLQKYPHIRGLHHNQIKQLIVTNLTMVSEELISKQSWIAAYELTKDVDEDDTPFVALAIELDTKLWTGDKVLIKGLQNKGADFIINTIGMKSILK